MTRSCAIFQKTKTCLLAAVETKVALRIQPEAERQDSARRRQVAPVRGGLRVKMNRFGKHLQKGGKRERDDYDDRFRRRHGRGERRPRRRLATGGENVPDVQGNWRRGRPVREGRKTVVRQAGRFLLWSSDYRVHPCQAPT